MNSGEAEKREAARGTLETIVRHKAELSSARDGVKSQLMIAVTSRDK